MNNKYIDKCPDCGKELYRAKAEFGKRCRECYMKARLPVGIITKRVHDIGLKAKKNSLMYQDYCPKCGKELWHRKQYIGMMCHTCAKGDGTHKMGHGYVSCKVDVNDPLYCMAGKNGYCFIHRLVMARHIGRPLSDDEIVHHINGIKTDNRIENLLLLPNQNEHDTFSLVKQLQEKIRNLEMETRLLRWQIERLQHGNAELNSEIESDKSGETIYPTS